LKRYLLLAVCALAIFASVFAGSAKASSDWYCTVPAGGNCVGGFNYWNHHYVKNLGSSAVFCGSYQPDGTRQGYAWVYGGQEKTISGWLYNRVICSNQGGAQTTLHLIDYQ
jgi:hypothetical protein